MGRLLSALTRLLSRKLKAPELKPSPSKAVTYYEFLCLNESWSCGFCRSKDGLAWVPEYRNVPDPPLAACTSSEGCCCAIVGLYEIDPANFIRSRGGIVTAGELAAYHYEREAPRRAVQQKREVAYEHQRAAQGSEKSDLATSAAHYRQAIQIWKELSLQGDAPEVRPDLQFSYLYNRLSLVLERAGQLKEAIAEIEDFRKVRASPTKYDLDSMTKREARLRSKLRRSVLVPPKKN